MITRTMNIQEVMNELKEDIHNIQAFAEQKRIKANKIIKRSVIFPVFLHAETISKMKNHWLIIFTAFSKVNIDYLIGRVFVCILETNQGKFVANLVNINGKIEFEFYTSHFFQRYAERCNIDLSGIELIKYYFCQNLATTYTYETENCSDGIINHVYGTSKEGISLGYQLKDINNSTFFKTFISNEMCKKDQMKKFAFDEFKDFVEIINNIKFFSGIEE